MGGRQEGQEDIKCSLGGCHAWLMPCPLAGDSEGKLGGCSPHNHCPRSIDRRPRRPPRYAHCHKRPWRNLLKKFPKMRRGRSSSRRVCLAVCVVGGVLIYASVAYTILRPATAPGGQPAMEGVARNRSNYKKRVIGWRSFPDTAFQTTFTSDVPIGNNLLSGKPATSRC